MPQEFHVVRCYACQIFQVQQVKKISKWVCKMCGEKQSLKKEYGRGSGQDCRRHVQRLNMTAGEYGNVGRGTQDSFQEQGHGFAHGSLEGDHRTPAESRQKSCFENPKPETSLSRWQAFVADDDNTDEISTQDDDLLPQLGNAEITLSRPVHQGRGGKRYGGWKSRRKRKREDFDQDIDVDSMTAIHQNRKSPVSATPQNRPAFSCSSKASSFQDREDIFPSPPKSLHRPPETAQQFSNVADTDRVQTGKVQVKNGTPGPNRSWNDKTEDTAVREVSKKHRPAETGQSATSKWGQFLQDSDDKNEDIIDNRGPAESGCTASSEWGQFLQDSEDINVDGNEDIIDNRGPAESGCTASSKWGQFLQDSEDINDDENENMIDNRGHVANPISEFKDTYPTPALVHTAAVLRDRQSTDQSHHTEDLIDNRGHVAKDTTQQIEDTYTPYAHLNSTKFPNNRQSTDPIQPVMCHETSVQGHRLDRTKAQGRKKVAQSSENKSCLQTELQKNVFSLEDEDLLDEVFQENW
ncbi:MRN complex-interacting protein-like [Patiria miniata]|uniref:MRN complex-interacting protein N-terminal domain-containing protein n=1 Tax=Patiria miniata TaxID=46514 RepID=A0A913ZL00_PATMI|nr:MRN complex-interacting protein-like [Patiria miniata]